MKAFTSVMIDVDLRERAKEYSTKSGMSFSRIMNQALLDFLLKTETISEDEGVLARERISKPSGRPALSTEDWVNRKIERERALKEKKSEEKLEKAREKREYEQKLSEMRGDDSPFPWMKREEEE